MGIEIERKFLVKESSLLRNYSGIEYCQGYLAHYLRNGDEVPPSTSQLPEGATVRIRTQISQENQKAVITIKGPPQGISRLEFEYSIPMEDATTLLQLCKKPLIYKKRYRVEYQGSLWEVDQFLGENEGLFIAEIELSDPEETFAHPPWLGAEVSLDPRYANSYLATTPFSTWPERLSYRERVA